MPKTFFYFLHFNIVWTFYMRKIQSAHAKPTNPSSPWDAQEGWEQLYVAVSGLIYSRRCEIPIGIFNVLHHLHLNLGQEHVSIIFCSYLIAEWSYFSTYIFFSKPFLTLLHKIILIWLWKIHDPVKWQSFGRWKVINHTNLVKYSDSLWKTCIAHGVLLCFVVIYCATGA